MIARNSEILCRKFYLDWGADGDLPKRDRNFQPRVKGSGIHVRILGGASDAYTTQNPYTKGLSR